MTDARVKLRGRLPDMASSAEIRPDGSLVVEVYDWSEEAGKWLGRDAAYLMIIAPEHKPGLIARLSSEGEPVPAVPDADQHLLALIQARFDDYYAAKKWLDEAGIPYEKDFDSWA